MDKVKISIREIAKLSGVSPSTVSRVINNNGRFSEDTRLKVQSIIDKYHYETNSAGKMLRMKKSNTIGIIVPDLTNYFFSDLVENLEKQFFMAGFSTMICDTGRDAQRELVYLKMLDSKMVDGMIVISGNREYNSSTILRKIPVICIDRKAADESVAFVSSDHYTGARLATNELLKAGTTPYLFRPEGALISSNRERVRGYKDEMRESNQPLQDDSIVSLSYTKQEVFEKKELIIRNALRTIFLHTQLPLGIFALSDALAADIIVAARSLNLNIPGDLKIIGFDDAPIAQYCFPQLTTIRQNTEKIVKQASQLLLQMIKGDIMPVEKRKIVDVSLVKRGTI